MSDQFSFKKASTRQSLEVFEKIPEFLSPYYNISEFESRLKHRKHINLIAYHKDEIAGFMTAYDRYQDGSLYLWLTGVLPDFRQKGLGQEMFERLESWARFNRYEKVLFKTRNPFKSMMILAIKRDYQIENLDIKKESSLHRIYFVKQL